MTSDAPCFVELAPIVLECTTAHVRKKRQHRVSDQKPGRDGPLLFPVELSRSTTVVFLFS